MPVHGMNVGEGPPNPAEADAAGYFAVFIDVARIIIVNEIVPECLREHAPRKHYQTDANARGHPTQTSSVEGG